MVGSEDHHERGGDPVILELQREDVVSSEREGCR